MNTNLTTKFQKRPKFYVEVKCIFVRISQIDTVQEKYFADVFIQAKWREPLLDDECEIKNVDLSKFWNPKLYIDNAFDTLKESSTLSVRYSENKNEAYMLEKRRAKGILRETLELQQFPFDCQDLSVTVSTQLPIEEIELVESNTDISKLNIADVLESQEWNLLNHVEVSFDEVMSDPSVGPKRRQVIQFTCRASRRFGYFMINHLMISCMLTFLAFCSFGVVSSNTFGRLQLCMINLLTTVTFKVALSQNLPKISYLTYLDKALLANLCTIMCLCLWHALTSLFYYQVISDTSSAQIISNKTAIIVKQIQGIEVILIPSILGTYITGIIVYGISIYFDAGRRRREMAEKDEEFEKKMKRINAADPAFDS